MFPGSFLLLSFRHFDSINLFWEKIFSFYFSQRKIGKKQKEMLKQLKISHVVMERKPMKVLKNTFFTFPCDFKMSPSIQCKFWKEIAVGGSGLWALLPFYQKENSFRPWAFCRWKEPLCPQKANHHLKIHSSYLNLKRTNVSNHLIDWYSSY